jgi:hypothetical protein
MPTDIPPSADGTTPKVAELANANAASTNVEAFIAISPIVEDAELGRQKPMALILIKAFGAPHKPPRSKPLIRTKSLMDPLLQICRSRAASSSRTAILSSLKG